MDGLKISECNSGDAQQICEIDKSCFSDAYSPQMIDSMLADKNTLTLKAELNGEMIAYMTVQIIVPEAEIIKIAVKNEFRKSGIGSLIYGKAVKKCQEKGVNRIFLEVNETNGAAISFYKKAGFSIMGVRQKYYGSNAAIIMSLAINADKE